MDCTMISPSTMASPSTMTSPNTMTCPSTMISPCTDPTTRHITSSSQHKPVYVTSLDDLVRQVHEAFDGTDVDVDLVTDIMESYKSNPADWRKFAKYDRYKYTRNLVDEGNGKFNLMLLCWGPSQVSGIHDHADAHCFMKVLSGSLEETRYAWPQEGEAAWEERDEDTDGMNVTGSGSLHENEVCYINDSLGLHRVSNPSDSEGCVSLHLYCPPFSSCQVFDERSGKKMRCPVTFFSKFGHKVKYCEN